MQVEGEEIRLTPAPGLLAREETGLRKLFGELTKIGPADNYYWEREYPWWRRVERSFHKLQDRIIGTIYAPFKEV